MFKKIVLSLVLMGIGGLAQAEDNPILSSSDAATLTDNFREIAHNLYQIADNSARICVGAALKTSSAFVRLTKFMAAHPVFGVTCIVGLTYGWCKWREKKQDFRATNKREITLVDLLGIRTISK